MADREARNGKRVEEKIRERRKKLYIFLLMVEIETVKRNQTRKKSRMVRKTET